MPAALAPFKARSVRFHLLLALLLGAGGGLHLVATEVAWKTFVSPLNVPAWQTLVTIQTGGNSGGSGGSDVVSGPDLLALRQAALPDVVAIGGFRVGRMSLTGREVSESIDVLRVTAGVFEAAGVVPRAGRHFNEDDEAPGAEPVVILREGTAFARFGASHQAIGRHLTLDGRPHRVVGIVPDDQDFPHAAVGLFVPANPRFTVVGRVISVPHFTLVARLRAPRPSPALRGGVAQTLGLSPDTVRIEPVGARLERERRPAALLIQVVAVGLLVCAALAALLLELNRVLVRLPEQRIRLALGAQPAVLVRERAVGAAAAGVVAWAIAVPLAWGLVRVFTAWWAGPGELRLRGLSPAALAVEFVVMVGAALVIVVGPAAWGARVSQHTLSQFDGLSGGSHTVARRVPASSMTLVAQIAVGTCALVLFLGFVQELARIQHLDWGLGSAEPPFVMDVRLPATQFPTAQRRAEALRQVLDALRDARPSLVPGLVQWIPGASRLPGSVEVGAAGISLMVTNQVVTAGAVERLGMRLIAGRGLIDRPSEPEVLVSRSLAVALFGGEEAAVGERVVVSGQPWRICGVVADVRESTSGDSFPAIYRTLADAAHGAAAGSSLLESMTLVLRSDEDGLAVRPMVTALASRIAPGIAFGELAPLRSVVDRLGQGVRLKARAAGFVGLLSVVMALLSFVAVLRAEVMRRLDDLAIRAALGARPSHLVGHMARRAVILGGSGLLTGALIGAFGLRYMASKALVAVASPWGAVATGAAIVLALLVLGLVVPASLIARLRPAALLRHG